MSAYRSSPLRCNSDTPTLPHSHTAPNHWPRRVDADTLPAMNRLMKTACWVGLLLGVMTAGGCGSLLGGGGPMQIAPVKKGTAIQPKFDTVIYRYDEENTLHFVGRSKSIDKATGQTVEQVMTMRVFWRPIGGKTSLNSGSINATFRYVLMTPTSVGVYEGAGMVRLSGKNGKPVTARMLDGDLRLTEASTSFHDTLGRCRLHGYLQANYDDARAMEMTLQAQRDLFNRSLNLLPPDAMPGAGPSTRPSTRPTTAPATMPAS